MTPKRTSEAECTPIRLVILTLDSHIAGAVERARELLRAELPGLDLRLHAATRFADPRAVEACCADIAQADIVFANMLFIEEHIRAVLPTLQARRDTCDAMVCAMSAGEVMRQTRMGSFRMDGSMKGPLALLRKLRGKSSGTGGAKDGGAGQMAMLRLLPRLLRFIPGKAQELRTYFLTLSYWLSGSSDNIADLVRMLIGRYADGPRRALRGKVVAQPPREYPDNGLYHPRLASRMTESISELPRPGHVRGTVGLVIMRSYVLAGDSGHYDSVIEKLEARGLRVIPAFASGLDARPAIEKFFFDKGEVAVDAVLSLTGFSLVGGPAFNDAKAAEEMLARLDVPYLAAQPLEFQSIEQWQASPSGLSPLESTIMVAIPELDGATGPIVFGGRSGGGIEPGGADDRHRRPRRDAGGPGGAAGRPAQDPARRAQHRHRPFQLPSQRRRHRHCRLSVGLRVAPPHPWGHAGSGLRRGSPSHRGGAARARARGGRHARGRFACRRRHAAGRARSVPRGAAAGRGRRARGRTSSPHRRSLRTATARCYRPRLTRADCPR